MAIRTMSLGEALENGYEVIGPDPIYREEEQVLRLLQALVLKLFLQYLVVYLVVLQVVQVDLH